MRNTNPNFPPLVTGLRVSAETEPLSKARSLLSKGRIGAGDLIWSDSQSNLQFAIVLEPEVARQRCGEMLFAAMVAFGDSVGAIAPPEIAVTYGWPNLILMNGAEVGQCDLQLSEDDKDGIPDWMILALSARINPGEYEMDPGLDASRTTMWDEGCGDLSRTELLESVSRHLVNIIHTWSEDGFKPVHQQWWARLDEKAPVNARVVANGSNMKLVGLDESGNALFKSGEAVTSVDTLEVLSADDKRGVY